MHGLIIVKSLLVRVLLIAHGLICAWRVVDTNDNQYCWVILVGLGFLLIETGLVIWLRNGREFKTVAFCIIFYLTCTTPSLWIIHVETANRKLYRLAESKLNARAAALSRHTYPPNSSLLLHRPFPTTTPLILSIDHIECDDKAWYYTDEQRWLDGIQESLLVVLSIGRLFISLNYMTIEQSGIVFLITLIHNADLLFLSHSLQYHDVIIERLWMYIGLILFTICLFHLAFIDNDGLTLLSDDKSIRKRRRLFIQNQNLRPLFRSLFIHDGPLFVYRAFIAAQIRCSKPSLILFMSKNLLMIAFHFYHIYHKSKNPIQNQPSTGYDHFVDTPSSTPISFQNSHQDRTTLERLLHRTLRRPLSVIRRRPMKIPRALFSTTPPSVSYPFARRRNDGGRARTAFALYGLPFRTPQIPRSPTISTCSSLAAKAFVH